MRTPKELKEFAFEEYIEEYLLASGYQKGNTANYNKEYALDDVMLFDFLEDTQENKLSRLKDIYKDQYRYKIIFRIDKELAKRGMIDVLRHGIKDYGVHLDLAYFKPASRLNPETLELYRNNRLSLTRQLKYSIKNENSVDICLFLNGLPVAVLELKNEFTGQSYQNAIQQFRYDRSPQELIFQFKKRVVVFYAVDTSEVYMTTQIAGENTFFLPLNKGRDGGAGNPDNPDNFKTSYLWEEILQRDTLLDILKSFVYIEKEEKKNNEGQPYIVEKIVFPRYHQLDVVRNLEAQVKIDGSGQNYLVQHSAGSGKTNSISWLAHRLANAHNEQDEAIFSSVVVITDRTVLDKQLQDSIYQLEHKHGVVEKIDKDSTQLAEALKGGSRIIISTLQKFPFVLEKVGELGDRKFAVIIDEAHSSTTGKNIDALTETLAVATLEEAIRADEEDEYDPDEEILKAIRKVGKQPNISFFAFTATPKAKTLEAFGTPGPDGLPRPFHLYSMRQAIEEEFILDVLEHYVTYATYFQIGKKIEDDPAFDKAKATKALTRYVSLHPHNIAQKTAIIVKHFRNVTMKKIGGRAKAMVVTSSRLHAVRYKLAFDSYIKDKGYRDLKTIVAFSGKVKDGGVEYTEPSMNEFKESETPDKFATDEYQVLLVAEKYQTGFDQPLLHTMYVDKKLAGVKAVQTLSRLNRTYKGKKETFVLDFVNKAEDIQEAFKPYYEKTMVEGITDPNLLYDLERLIYTFGIALQPDVEMFAEIFFKPKDKKATQDKVALNHFVNVAVERYKNLDFDQQDDFAKKAGKFTRLYSFIIQITPFEDVALHKLYLYLAFLLRKLPKTGRPSINLSDEVAMEYYKIKETFNGTLAIKPGDELPPIPPAAHDGGGAGKEDEKEKLSTIIERLNKRFGTDFTTAELLAVEQIGEDFRQDEMLVKKAKVNSLEDFRYAYEKVFESIVLNRRAQNQSFFTRILNDEEFRTALMEGMLYETYQKLKSS